MSELLIQYGGSVTHLKAYWRVTAMSTNLMLYSDVLHASSDACGFKPRRYCESGTLDISLYLCNWQSNVIKIPMVNISFTELVSFKITVTVETHTWPFLISLNSPVMLHLFWLCALSDLDSREIATRPALSRELQFQVECRSWFHVMQFIMTQRFGQSLTSLIQRGERYLTATKSC